MDNETLPPLELWDECGGPDFSDIANPDYVEKAKQVVIDFYNAARAELKAQLSEIGELTGIAGVDQPLSVLECVRAAFAQRDERIREQQLVEDRLRRSWHEDVEREQKRAEAAEQKVKELQQSAEVAARNMRDLVAEHVRERDALSERVKTLEQIADKKEDWGLDLKAERDALQARLEAIRKQPTIALATRYEVKRIIPTLERFEGKKAELIERPDLST